MIYSRKERRREKRRISRGCTASRGRRFFHALNEGKGVMAMGRLSEERKNKVLDAYFEEALEPEEIAERMGLSERTVRSVLSDREVLEPYRKRSEAAKLRAQICVNESAEEAARSQAQLLRGEETQERVRQQAAKDILDRAGVRVPKEEKKDIRITFTSCMPKLGMPGRDDEQA